MFQSVPGHSNLEWVMRDVSVSWPTLLFIAPVAINKVRESGMALLDSKAHPLHMGMGMLSRTKPYLGTIIIIHQPHYKVSHNCCKS